MKNETKFFLYVFVTKITSENIRTSLAIWNSEKTFVSRAFASIYSERCYVPIFSFPPFL